MFFVARFKLRFILRSMPRFMLWFMLLMLRFCCIFMLRLRWYQGHVATRLFKVRFMFRFIMILLFIATFHVAFQVPLRDTFYKGYVTRGTLYATDCRYVWCRYFWLTHTTYWHNNRRATAVPVHTYGSTAAM